MPVPAPTLTAPCASLYYLQEEEGRRCRLTKSINKYPSEAPHSSADLKMGPQLEDASTNPSVSTPFSGADMGSVEGHSWRAYTIARGEPVSGERPARANISCKGGGINSLTENRS